MFYYGLIKQSTGEDWLVAKLSLSTANPSIDGSVPELGVKLLKLKLSVHDIEKRLDYYDRKKNWDYGYACVIFLTLNFSMSS